jgi:flagellar biosynthesis/type III secretory pathway protein FliH
VWQLLAETEPSTSLTGATGWVGAGLLGVVVVWLLKHLTDLAKERKEFGEARDKIIETLVTSHAHSLEKLAIQNRETAEKIAKEHRESLEKERQEFLAALNESRREFREWLSVIAANDAAGLKSLTDAVSREIVSLNKAIESMK